MFNGSDVSTSASLKNYMKCYQKARDNRALYLGTGSSATYVWKSVNEASCFSISINSILKRSHRLTKIGRNFWYIDIIHIRKLFFIHSERKAIPLMFKQNKFR